MSVVASFIGLRALTKSSALEISVSLRVHISDSPFLTWGERKSSADSRLLFQKKIHHLVRTVPPGADVCYEFVARQTQQLLLFL